MKMTDYAPGTPCWVDLGTSDMEGSKAFYGGLFGWNAEISDDPATGGYGMFLLDGVPAAGVMPLMSPEQPVAWSTYVSVTDSEATAAKIEASGGKVLVAPMDVTDVGRMAVFVDPGGAAFGTWQPGTFPGAGVVNEPGSLCWDELATRDAATAKAFYPAVFGWGAETNPMGEDMEYTEWKLGGRDVGGMMEMDDKNFPPEVPPHWAVYFATADCQASADKVAKLGGSVTVPPTEIPVGTFAVCQDPQGAFFSLIQLSEERAAQSGGAAA
ncbi:VOC family protein [Catenulispora yoronensis]|uniref:VOC family protein n=1 Tax=Catenulispora yoronensis TaxID=450799 RepID=A0ABN2V6Z5_9ACTN